MNTFIGIDLGTSGVKLLLVSANGGILNQTSQDYPLLRPREGWTEQEPSLWWDAVCLALDGLLKGQDKSAVKGISFGGQMHGLVAVDVRGEVIRPCILWNDSRTEKQTEYLNGVIGKDKLSAYTGNIAFAGFTAPKLLWLKENEPENFAKISKILLPKDYLTYKFTGTFATDYSDASGTLLLDVKNKCWSREMCGVCGISAGQLPRLYESFSPVGNIKKDVAARFGLSENVKIMAGAGDNAAAAVGTGTVEEGGCNISLGTSGTVFIPTAEFAPDKANALHSFCHADGKWHLMGCILSAASARKWWLEDILGSCDYNSDDREIEKVSSGGIIFLPYLCGERSPHNDVGARGAFIGLTSSATKAQLGRAVMEGVAFALKDCLEAAKKNGANPVGTTLCGGGAKSGVWRRIISDVLGIPVGIPATEQGPAYGAAILAMVGWGQYKTCEEAAHKLISVKEVINPDAVNSQEYERKYQIFKKLYPLLKQAGIS